MESLDISKETHEYSTVESIFTHNLNYSICRICYENITNLHSSLLHHLKQQHSALFVFEEHVKLKENVTINDLFQSHHNPQGSHESLDQFSGQITNSFNSCLSQFGQDNISQVYKSKTDDVSEFWIKAKENGLLTMFLRDIKLRIDQCGANLISSQDNSTDLNHYSSIINSVAQILGLNKSFKEKLSKNSGNNYPDSNSFSDKEGDDESSLGVNKTTGKVSKRRKYTYWTPELIQAAYKMLDEGRTIKQICSALKVSQASLLRLQKMTCPAEEVGSQRRYSRAFSCGTKDQGNGSNQLIRTEYVRGKQGRKPYSNPKLCAHINAIMQKNPKATGKEIIALLPDSIPCKARSTIFKYLVLLGWRKRLARPVNVENIATT